MQDGEGEGERLEFGYCFDVCTDTRLEIWESFPSSIHYVLYNRLTRRLGLHPRLSTRLAVRIRSPASPHALHLSRLLVSTVDIPCSPYQEVNL